MSAGVPAGEHLSLPAAPASVREARRFVTRSLEDLSPDALDTVALLTAEVVTNAILHALSPVSVTVERIGQLARVSVHDDDPTPPVVHDHGTDASTGRGMRLVQAMSSDWGSRQDAVGKTVWFEVAANPDADAAAESYARMWADVEPL